MRAAFLVALTLASAPASAAVKNCLKTKPPPLSLDDLRDCQQRVHDAAVARAEGKGTPLTEQQLDAIDDQQRAEARRFLNGGDKSVRHGDVSVDDGVDVADKRAAAVARAAGFDTLPDEPLPTVDGRPSPSLISCSAAKCVTFVVAPWCPYCRAASANIVKLRAYLGNQGVPSRVVVTADEEDKLSAYAEKFGGDAMYDPQKLVKVPGFPMYCISGKGGAIVKEGPISKDGISDPAEWASSVGVP